MAVTGPFWAGLTLKIWRFFPVPATQNALSINLYCLCGAAQLVMLEECSQQWDKWLTDWLTKTQTSTPVIRTGVYPHMPITITANSLQHWTSPSKPLSPWLSSQVWRTSPTCYRFFNFWPWGLTPGPKVTKRGDDRLPT